MTVTIINDCRDDNAAARQTTRASSLFGCNVSFVGVKNDLEASGNIIDVLDALGEEDGVIVVNVAPRNGKAKKWINGTPFGYFKFKNTLVVSSIDGLTLSLVKKFGLTTEINVLDIPTVLDAAVADGRIESEVRDHVVKGQFRSFDFVPRVAHYLWTGFKVPSEVLHINEIPDSPQNTVWWIDSFGNCKTTITSNEFEYEVGDSVKTNFGDIKYYNRLKDVPDNEPAIIQGSSGLAQKRFIELVVQGDSAGKKFTVSSNDVIL
jgi:hypothetical protein